MDEVERLARIIWDYHHMHHELKPADCILTLGSHDLRVADWAVDLYFQGYAPYLIFSGGIGRLTRGLFERPEAEVFANIARQRGVPEDRLLLETRSTNTSENIVFTRCLLSRKGLDFASFILVQKPYMERRAYAAFKKHWPGKDVIVTSPPLTFDEYVNENYHRDLVIEAIVGDLQRIKVYPERGYTVPQEIPDEVWQAFERLVALGYTKQLVEPPTA
jgi:uncharacterized SAM-binding protein YcdF (DUF218 family)